MVEKVCGASSKARRVLWLYISGPTHKMVGNASYIPEIYKGGSTLTCAIESKIPNLPASPQMNEMIWGRKVCFLLPPS